MFERFSDPARRLVVQAQEEARRLDHGYIGTEHMLLAALRLEGTVAAVALHSAGISYQPVRQKIDAVVGRGAPSADGGHIPFTPPAKKMLELALIESQDLGTGYIGSGHIVLGLIRAKDTVAYETL